MKVGNDRATTRFKYWVWLIPVLLLAACEPHTETQQASESEFRLTSPSKNGHFIVTVGTEAKHRLPVGKFHNWLVTITDAQSKPVYPVIVSVGGGMPSHGHGLPTQPQVTEHLGQGVYRLEGVKFNMSGDWVIQFRILTPEREDSVKFDFNVHL